MPRPNRAKTTAPPRPPKLARSTPAARSRPTHAPLEDRSAPRSGRCAGQKPLPSRQPQDRTDRRERLGPPRGRGVTASTTLPGSLRRLPDRGVQRPRPAPRPDLAARTRWPALHGPPRCTDHPVEIFRDRPALRTNHFGPNSGVTNRKPLIQLLPPSRVRPLNFQPDRGPPWPPALLLPQSKPARAKQDHRQPPASL